MIGGEGGRNTGAQEGETELGDVDREREEEDLEERETERKKEKREAIKSGNYVCPDCGSTNIVCQHNCRNNYCHKNCWRHKKQN